VAFGSVAGESMRSAAPRAAGNGAPDLPELVGPSLAAWMATALQNVMPAKAATTRWRSDVREKNDTRSIEGSSRVKSRWGRHIPRCTGVFTRARPIRPGLPRGHSRCFVVSRAPPLVLPVQQLDGLALR